MEDEQKTLDKKELQISKQTGQIQNLKEIIIGLKSEIKHLKSEIATLTAPREKDNKTDEEYNTEMENKLRLMREQREQEEKERKSREKTLIEDVLKSVEESTSQKGADLSPKKEEEIREEEKPEQKETEISEEQANKYAKLITDLEDQVKTLKEENTHSRKVHAELMKERNELQFSLAKMIESRELESAASPVDIQREEIKKLNEKITKLDDELNEKQQELKELKGKLHGFEENDAKKEKRINDLNDLIKNVREQINKSTEELKNKNNLILQKQSTIEEKDQLLEKLQTEIKEAKEKTNSAATGSINLIQEFEKKIEDFEKSSLKLKEKVTDLEEKLKTANGKIIELARQKEQKAEIQPKSSDAGVNELITELQTKIEKQKKEIVMLKSYNDQLKQKGEAYDTLKTDYEKLKETNKTLQTTSNKSAQSVTGAKESIPSNANSSSTSHMDRGEITELVEELRNKVEKLTKENAKLKQAIVKPT